MFTEIFHAPECSIKKLNSLFLFLRIVYKKAEKECLNTLWNESLVKFSLLHVSIEWDSYFGPYHSLHPNNLLICFAHFWAYVDLLKRMTKKFVHHLFCPLSIINPKCYPTKSCHWILHNSLCSCIKIFSSFFKNDFHSALDSQNVNSLLFMKLSHKFFPINDLSSPWDMELKGSQSNPLSCKLSLCISFFRFLSHLFFDCF